MSARIRIPNYDENIISPPAETVRTKDFNGDELPKTELEFN